jgi:hypothetical protein
MTDATVYDPRESSVGGIHALFIVRGDRKAYNLPSHPEVPTIYLRPSWISAFATAGALLAGVLLSMRSRDSDTGDGVRRRGHERQLRQSERE